LPSSGSSTLSGTLGSVSSNTTYSFGITATDSSDVTSVTQNYTMTVNQLPFSATGGTVTTSGSYTYRTFTSSSNLVVSGQSKTMDYLLVAGGGGGGRNRAGGGGAGGYLSISSTTISSGTYPIVVGAGGVAQVDGVLNTNGADSTFNSSTAVGGGRAGGNGGLGGQAGGNGGSGGGAGSSTNYSGGSGTAGQGNAGGDTGSNGNGASGGGAGGAGENARSGSGTGSFTNGGAGLAYFDQGTYSRGGGGAASPDDIGQNTSTPNTANTGNGGGGGSGNVAGLAGASGIVIIRYLT